MMISESEHPSPFSAKELLKERLRSVDPTFRYYKTLFHLTNDLIAVTDGDVIIDANQAFIRFFSEAGIDVFAPDFSLSHIFVADDKYGNVYEGYRQERWFESIFRADKDYYRVGIRSNGAVHEFNIALQHLEPSEEIFVVTMTDITRMMGYRSALEANLRDSVEDRAEAQFLVGQYDRAINAANLVSKSDLYGTLTYVNEAFCQALKYSHDELIGQNVEIFCVTEQEEVCFESIWREIQSGNIWKGTLQNIDKENEIHYFDTTIVPIRNQRDETIEYLSIRHEITEMVKAKEEAIATLEAKTRFFDQVSHELRTPLNAILNFTDQSLESFDHLAEDEDERELVRLYLQRAYKNAENLLSLINSLLDIAKLRSGRETFAIDVYDAVELVQEAFENCSSLNKNHALNYRFSTNTESLQLKCDPLKLKQVITNLISNAFKFTRSGFVDVRVRRENNHGVIEIEDSGVGIPPNKLAAIFEPFEQARDQDIGTGLGLSIVREYAKRMGFELSVSSLEGMGSCFRLMTERIITKEGSEWVI